MNKIVKAVISVLASGLFLSAATFCWFINENEINFPASFGSTKTAYFAGGDGTEENPYQINSPVHLYNLAWLQYFGYFNLNPEQNNGAAQSHFVLTDNVDMSGFGSAIPPIGTAQFPFIGSFNGNDKTISGVTVSDNLNYILRIYILFLLQYTYLLYCFRNLSAKFLNAHKQ